MRGKYIAVNLINFFTAVVTGILGLRFLLKLFGANSDTGFVSWLYEMSADLLAPFRGIFPVRVFENQYVLEFSTLFAMLMYVIAGLILLAIVDFVTRDDGVVVERRRR